MLVKINRNAITHVNIFTSKNSQREFFGVSTQCYTTTMKTYIVTGVSRGIGKAIKEMLLTRACVVYGIDKVSDDSEQELKDKYPNQYFFTLLDLANRGVLVTFANGIDIKIDGIIHNAGEIYFNTWNEFDLKVWDRTLEVNLTSIIALTHLLYAKINVGGSIVSIASVDGSLAAFDTIAYAVSKAGLINLTKSLRAVLGKEGIRVNAIAPGWVETDMTKETMPEITKEMTPLKRNATPQDIAELVCFLLSPESSFINCQTITIDGGLFSVDYTLWKESTS